MAPAANLQRLWSAWICCFRTVSRCRVRRVSAPKGSRDRGTPVTRFLTRGPERGLKWGAGTPCEPERDRSPNRGWTSSRVQRIIALVLMSAWSTVALSLGSAGVGAASALAATSMQLRQTRRDRLETERASWRDRGAAVLGPLLGVLDDMEPQAIAERGGRSSQTIENIGRRWWRARDELLVFGAANPSARIAVGANDLVAAVSAAWTSMIGLNEQLQAGTGDRDLALERASSDYERALSLAHDLADLVRVPEADDHSGRQGIASPFTRH